MPEILPSEESREPRVPTSSQQAQVDAFCKTCDFHNDPKRDCAKLSYPYTANTSVAHQYTDQVRYAIFNHRCAFAEVNEECGEMKSDGFHPQESSD